MRGSGPPAANGGAGRLVRPFVLTGGRTRPALPDLEMEALVTATALGQARAATSLSREQREIVHRASMPLSIVEASAYLHVPLGVARVLVGDLVSERLLTLHRPLDVRERPDRSLLERVLNGIREL